MVKTARQRQREPFEDRFWANVRIAAPLVCWEWTAAVFRGGYGAIVRSGKKLKAHRVAYEFFNGPVPAGMVVRHRCDNPLCCNPQHLLVGTPADNMADKYARGRAVHVRGSAHGNAKLNEQVVREIRGSAETTATLSKRYGVSQSLVSKVRRGAMWSHVT